MIKKLRNTFLILLSIVLAIIVIMTAFGATVRFPSAGCLEEYDEFYFCKKDILIKPFLNIGSNANVRKAKIWFLPGQKKKLLNALKEDVNKELKRIAAENSDMIKNFEISDDFKKIYIYIYAGRKFPNRYLVLTELRGKIEYRVLAYFQILDGYGNTDFDGDILNYVEVT